MNHMTRILPPRSVTPNLMNWSSYTSLMEQPKQFEQLGLDPVLLEAMEIGVGNLFPMIGMDRVADDAP